MKIEAIVNDNITLEQGFKVFRDIEESGGNEVSFGMEEQMRVHCVVDSFGAFFNKFSLTPSFKLVPSVIKEFS